MWHLAYTWYHVVCNPDLVELRRKGKGDNTTANDFTIPVTYKSVFGVVSELIEKDEVKESFDHI